MIKSITNFLIIFFIFKQLKSQISQIDQNGYNAFCDETLHIDLVLLLKKNKSTNGKKGKGVDFRGEKKIN